MNKKIKFDSMVICSTLNQMVNYIAIKQHDIDINNIYNIRLKNIEDKFDYDKWDENLESTLGGEFESNKIIKYSNKQISNHKNIIKKLIKKFGGTITQNESYPFKEEKILWNITGGQRHFVMAITEYVYKYRTQDVIVYFEGDKEKMYYYTKNEKIKDENILKNKDYKMTIPIALRLMGFKVSGRDQDKTSKYYNFLISDSKNKFLEICKQQKISEIEEKSVENVYKQLNDEFNWYHKFYRLYYSSENLRKLLINSNRYQKNSETKFYRIKEEIEVYKEKIQEEAKIMLNININDVLNEQGYEILDKSIGNHKNAKVFGYILERITLYKVLEVLRNNPELLKNIADIDSSVKIGDKNSDDKGLVDEFDILIVTKKGKVIMIECKSGGMTGDNAKSHNYSTYAIAGVYGAPILICPVLENNNIEKEEKFDTKISIQDKKVCEPNNDVYEHVRSARKAARKANLNICYIDKIAELIKKGEDKNV